MAITVSYDGTFAKVEVNADALGTDTTATVERSADQSHWTTVRGGEAARVSAGVLQQVNDFEFTPDVVNYYRVSSSSVSFNSSIAPILDGVWLKSIPHPFLNRKLAVVDYGEVSRPARGGTFDIIGRSDPVAVNGVRGSRRYTLIVMTRDFEEEKDLDSVMAISDVVFLQGPSDCRIPMGYYQIQDVSESRKSPRGAKRYWSLPLIEVRAPADVVVGALSTCQTVLNDYATCQEVLDSFATCQDLLELLGAPGDVVVA